MALLDAAADCWRFDVDMALAACGSPAGSEGVATVPVPRLSTICLAGGVITGGGCIIACTARVVWLFCEGGWTRGWHVDAEEGERGFCATAGWMWVGGTRGIVGIVVRRVARRSWEDVSCVCPVDYGRGN